MKLRIIAAGTVLLGLGACGSDPYIGRSEALSSLGTPGLGVSMRQFAGPQTYLAPMPTAVVLLKEGQDSRNAEFCKTFIGEQEAGPYMDLAGGKAGNIVLTRWPLVAPQYDSDPQTCPAMLLGYDHQRANALLASFTPSQGSQPIGAEGPYILQIMPNGAAILLDGSTVRPEELRAWTIGWLAAAKAQAANVAPKPGENQASASGAERGARAPGTPPTTPPGSNGGTPNTGTPAQADQRPWWDRLRDGAVALIGEHVPHGKVILGGIRWMVGPEPEKPKEQAT